MTIHDASKKKKDDKKQDYDSVRKLTTGEVALASTVFGNRLDYEKVKIHHGSYLPFVFLLSGCPGKGDRLQLDETAQVKLVSDSICFHITNAQDYQPAIISVNLRGTPPKKQGFIDNPSLSIRSEQLCIPPSFYQFADNGKYIVYFILTSARNVDEPMKFVVGVGIDHGKVHNFPLTDKEILRPYGSIEVSE